MGRLVQVLRVVLLITVAHTATGRRYSNDSTGALIAPLSNDTGMKICDNGFTLHAASVSCRARGAHPKDVYIVLDTSGRGQRGLVRTSGDGCKGSESDLSQCFRARAGTCRRGYVLVKCNEKDIHITMAALSVYVNPQEVKGYVNDTVTVTCAVNSTSKKTFPWFRYEWKEKGSVMASSPSLTVPLKRDMNLTCSVFYRKFEIKKATSSLKAYYPPPAYQTHNITVVVGTTLDLIRLISNKNDNNNTVISNPPPSFKWMKLQRGSVWREEHPVLRSVNKTRSGTYVVRIRNKMELTDGRSMDGNGVMMVHLHVIDGPVRKCIKDYFAPVNSTFTIYCANSSWTKYLEVNWTSKTENRTTNNYTINSVQKENEGNYSCSFFYYNISSSDNVYINRTKYTCNMTLHVVGNSPNFTVWEGGNTTLTLKNFNTTSKNGKWHKVVNGVMNDSLDLGSFPTIENVTRSEAGIYIYKVNNNISDWLKLDVLSYPNVTCPKRTSVQQGSTLTLTCGVDPYAERDTNVTWRRQSGYQNLTSTERQFALDGISEEDEGVYVCNASRVMTDDWNVTKQVSGECETEVIVYEGRPASVLTLAVVCAVFSVCVLALVGAVVYLTRRLYCSRNEKGNSSGVSLPMTTTTTSNSAKQTPDKGNQRRRLPNAPNIPLPNSPGDLQQELYENT